MKALPSRPPVRDLRRSQKEARRLAAPAARRPRSGRRAVHVPLGAVSERGAASRRSRRVRHRFPPRRTMRNVPAPPCSKTRTKRRSPAMDRKAAPLAQPARRRRYVPPSSVGFSFCVRGGRTPLDHRVRRRLCGHRRSRRGGALSTASVREDRARGAGPDLAGVRCTGRADLGGPRRHRHSRPVPSGRRHSHRHPVQSGGAGPGPRRAAKSHEPRGAVSVRSADRVRRRGRRARGVSARRPEPAQRGRTGARAPVQGTAHLCRRSRRRGGLGRGPGPHPAHPVRVHARSGGADDDARHQRRRAGTSISAASPAHPCTTSSRASPPGTPTGSTDSDASPPASRTPASEPPRPASARGWPLPSGACCDASSCCAPTDSRPSRSGWPTGRCAIRCARPSVATAERPKGATIGGGPSSWPFCSRSWSPRSGKATTSATCWT